jgi:hypothetical protein
VNVGVVVAGEVDDVVGEDEEDVRVVDDVDVVDAVG